MNQTFHGVIAREVADSTPWWPEPNVPPASAPNVLVALLDDTGFAHLGCFGSAIDTPNFDRLAARGLRYSNFHTTALCSPSRACLLTGRNHHAVGMRAGVQKGDVLVEFDGISADLDEGGVIAHAVQKRRAGDVVPIRMLRKGREMNFRLKLQ